MNTSTKTYKKPNEMTDIEKSERIFRLQNKFYDDKSIPSVLLETEMERTSLSNDPSLLSGIQQLKALESRAAVLRNEYDIKLTNALIPLVRGFEQQQKKLHKEHEEECNKIMRTFGPIRTIQMEVILQKQESKLADLRHIQEQQKADLKKKLSAEMDKCHADTYATFMKFVHQIYK